MPARLAEGEPSDIGGTGTLAVDTGDGQVDLAIALSVGSAVIPAQTAFTWSMNAVLRRPPIHSSPSRTESAVTGTPLLVQTMFVILPAFDKLQELKDSGQIRRFTGNDYADDLAAGNVVIAQAYSGDVVQLQKDNPDLKFVVPESGSTTFLDTMVIPYTTQNQKAAEEWINYVYDRANYAKLVAQTQYVPVLSDMTDELNKIARAVRKAQDRLTETQYEYIATAGYFARVERERVSINHAMLLGQGTLRECAAGVADRPLSADETKERLARGDEYVIRLKVPRHAEVRFDRPYAVVAFTALGGEAVRADPAWGAMPVFSARALPPSSANFTKPASPRACRRTN